MKLNHTNLCSSDVAALAGIFSRHFDFEVLQMDQVPDTGDRGPVRPGSPFALLRGSDGFSLILTEIGPHSPTTYPTDFHVGFLVEAPEEVHAKHKELSEAGCQPGPIHTFEAMGKSWTAFYCSVGDGIRIEVNASV